jgi:hypothetical protein
MKLNLNLRTRLIAVLFLALSLFFFISPNKINAASNYGSFLEHFESLTLEGMDWHNWNNFLGSMLYTMVGDVTQTEEQGQPQSQNNDQQHIGALSFTSGLIGSVYSAPPASGVYYAYDILHNLGAKTAYAQGVGFSGLQPILPVWKAFRNITYVFFTIIFIGIGLAIMLRVKISPQAVITINNALPKVIGALILVTFSYAIAGFLIDLMYVFIALGINVLKVGGVDPGMFNLPLIGTGGRPFPRTVINSGFFALMPMFSPVKQGVILVGGLIGGLVGSLGGIWAGGPVASIVGLGGGLVAGPVLIMIIWTIIALILFLKLLFNLIKSYIRIILLIILSPLQIMLGAVPGSQGGFGQWFKSIFAEILIFPAVVVVAMIGAFIMQNAGLGQMWVAPLIGPPNFLGSATNPIGGGIANAFVQTIIGIGFLFILPGIPDMVRGALGVEAQGFGEIVKGTFPMFTDTTQELGPKAGLSLGASGVRGIKNRISGDQVSAGGTEGAASWRIPGSRGREIEKTKLKNILESLEKFLEGKK